MARGRLGAHLRGANPFLLPEGEGTTGQALAIARLLVVERIGEPAGREIELGNVEVVGPGRVKLHSDNIRGQIAARGGVRFFDVLSLELIAGLALDSTEVRFRNADVQATEEEFTPGFLAGGRATVRPIALFDVYAQYTANFADHWRTIDDTEVGLELNLMRNFSIYSGYRRWSYEESFSADSDWDIDIRGPTAGASLKF